MSVGRLPGLQPLHYHTHGASTVYCTALERFGCVMCRHVPACILFLPCCSKFPAHHLQWPLLACRVWLARISARLVVQAGAHPSESPSPAALFYRWSGECAKRTGMQQQHLAREPKLACLFHNPRPFMYDLWWSHHSLSRVAPWARAPQETRLSPCLIQQCCFFLARGTWASGRKPVS